MNSSNKYSKYFNSDFNFNNIVPSQKWEMVNKLQNMNCSGDIMLEPRLQEYLKKKKFYKENTIDPCISPEQEFQITSFDKRILKSFLRGKRDFYENKNYNKLLKGNNKQRYFPSSNFKEDPRVPQIDKKNKKNDDEPINRGMFVPEKGRRYYEDPVNDNNNIMDSRDFPDIMFQNNLNNEVSTYQDNNYNSDFNHIINSNNKKNRNNNDPRNKYIISDLSNNSCKNNKSETHSQPEKNYYDRSYTNYTQIDKNDIKSYQKRYGEDLVPTYSNASEMDLTNKKVIPNVASKSKKELNPSNYRLDNYFNQNHLINTEIESDLLKGSQGSRPRNRSYGYKNPEENYFDFVDPCIKQNVEPWERGGIPTRLENKLSAKNTKYDREVM